MPLPISNVPAPGDPAFPSLINISTADLVGPLAANRQPLTLQDRTDTLRSILNECVDQINAWGTGGPGGLDLYLRRDGTLPMAGNLDMDSNQIINLANPSANSHAVNLGYADGRYVNVTGDAMSGELNMGNNRISNLQDPDSADDALNRGYADARYLLEANNLSDLTNVATARNNLDVYGKSEVYTKTESDARFVNVTGDSMSGFLTLHADPTANLHAATKQYVDNAAAATGVQRFQVITGDFTMPSDTIRFRLWMSGGGGGGGAGGGFIDGSVDGDGGGGGGGGGNSGMAFVTPFFSPEGNFLIDAVTIGSGGTGGTGSVNNGTGGGTGGETRCRWYSRYFRALGGRGGGGGGRSVTSGGGSFNPSRGTPGTPGIVSPPRGLTTAAHEAGGGEGGSGSVDTFYDNANATGGKTPERVPSIGRFEPFAGNDPGTGGSDPGTNGGGGGGGGAPGTFFDPSTNTGGGVGGAGGAGQASDGNGNAGGDATGVGAGGGGGSGARGSSTNRAGGAGGAGSGGRIVLEYITLS